ncbi:protein translocase subunit SecF [Desulfuromonas sp. CSMB_57]|uniref:protein translocase subunit SecF n=1 Tax=Desulfuromonas sp. CSMB_57 TaxID=2807629 RepID=UPI001CD1ACBA|nr:protein translocase subunit SecF [Desulfuromonas sp. CSMB_57]
MQIIKPDINIDFVGKKGLAIVLSLVLILAGLVSLVAKGGPRYGIDFAGGTLIQVKFNQPTDAATIRGALAPLNLRGLTVQRFEGEGDEFLLRAQESSAALEGLSHRITEALEGSFGEGQLELRRMEMVGPQAGRELRNRGLLAVLYAMIGILIYVSWRFKFRFAVGAILALLHDVLFTVGIFSLLNKEIDLPIIAAFLGIVGYSLNDTIIVYDRIRENTGKIEKESFPSVINRSINETLSRTIMTSGTTLLVVLALLIFGGGVIQNFALALFIGIMVGTYSSVFVASPVLLYWDEYRARRRGAKG